jgi:hypothetical protein
MNDEDSVRSIRNERQHQVARGFGATSMSLIHGTCGMQFFECDIADHLCEAVRQVVWQPSDCESSLIRRLPPTSCASVVSAQGKVQHISMHLEHSQDVRIFDQHSCSMRFVIEKWKPEK